MHFWLAIDSMKIRTHLAAPFLCLLMTASALAVNGNSDMLSSASIERAGLVSDWFTRIDSGPRSRIVNMVLQVNDEITKRIYLVEYDGRVEKISQHDLSPFGKPYGIEGAEAQANLRKEIIMKELEAQRKKPEVNIRAISLPKSTIYAADLGGHIIAIDADTGQHLWSTKVGKRRDLTAGVGASRNYVAAVNGSTVYLLNAANGKVLWSKKCENSPNAAPAVSNKTIYVPLVNGRLEAFSLDNKGLYSKSFVAFGASIAQPLVTNSTVSWATSSGHYSVAALDGKKVQYQLVADGSFSAGGTADKDTVYVATTHGRVYAFDESRGSIHWEYETGDRILDSPVVVGRSLFVIAAEGRMHRIDTFSGRPAEGWERPISGVRKYVGVSRDRIYVLNENDELTALDKNTGAIVSRIRGRVGQVLPNFQSDRLYVGSERGLLQCIRENSNNYPVFHGNESEAVAVDASEKATEPDEMEAAEDDPFADESDPFASDDSADSDPFASPDESSADDSDPFAGDDSSDQPTEDPFADDSDQSPPAEAEDDDPFAGDDSSDDSEEDPFGDDDSDDSDPFGG